MILIDYKSRKPIYEQIVNGMKQMIISGVLERDEQLPSVRQLAGELAINPNTIQKAYAELERQGVIYSLKGRGSFVGSSLAELRNVQKTELLEQVAEVSTQLCAIQVPMKEVCAVVQRVYQEQEEGSSND